MLTPEELLRPRYKVIADYPSTFWSIGDIIDPEELHTQFEKYPHLFQKLEWWQERGIDDMPEYVKFFNNVYRISGWDFSAYITGYIDSKDPLLIPKVITMNNDVYPDTKEEYESFIKQQNNIPPGMLYLKSKS